MSIFLSSLSAAVFMSYCLQKVQNSVSDNLIFKILGGSGVPPHPLNACASSVCLLSHLVGPHSPAKKNLPMSLLSVSPLKGNHSTHFCKRGSPCMRFEKFCLYFIHAIKFILVVSKHNFSLFVAIMMPLFATREWHRLWIFTNESFYVKWYMKCFIYWRASHRYREITGSNPVEVLTFSGFYAQLLKLRS